MAERGDGVYQPHNILSNDSQYTNKTPGFNKEACRLFVEI
ncbi:hypothetical protein JOD43_000199 [Pullulanibacillus pueri]|nr:hypothetical protein [Pullulanibacillus pueri]